MPELQKLQTEKLQLQPLKILQEALGYIKAKSIFFALVLIFNITYLGLYDVISGGFSNPLSILWLVGYYIFWCVFYRYYYGLRPYFFLKAITASLKPSTKAVVVLFLVMTLIALLPMLPLFLGYNDLYLTFYENYMHMIESLSHQEPTAEVWNGIMVVYGVFCLLAPSLICQPYMAWIASLCRRSFSFKQVREKMQGNYWNLVFISLVLVFPEAFIDRMAKSGDLFGYVSISLNALLFIYTNVVFAKIYDFFYGSDQS